jgi:uncharacterized RDD family membrane protein YckC
MRMLNPRLGEPAGIGRRLAAMLYEAILMFAIVFFASLVFYGAASGQLGGWSRHVFQAYLFLVLGLYLVWCWTRGGQTLPMKAWKLQLVNADGTRISARQAILRYLLGWGSLLALGAGYAWALFDRDRQFMHDRLLGTRIIRIQA